MRKFFALLSFTLCCLMAQAQFANQRPVMGQPQQSNVSGTAKAPYFTVPMAMNLTDTIAVDAINLQFIWMPAMVENATGPVNFAYDLRIVELLPGQQPDYAISNNPIVYKRNGLMATNCMLPNKLVKNEIKPGCIYVVQVKAIPSSKLVRMENNGLSPYVMFRKKL